MFNFDVPHHADDYVHRIGRTGRAGLTGTAISLVAPSDTKSIAVIEKLMNMQIPWMGDPAKADGEAEATTEAASATQQRPDRGNRRPAGERSSERGEGRGSRGGRNRDGRDRKPRADQPQADQPQQAVAQPRQEQARPPREQQRPRHEPKPQHAVQKRHQAPVDQQDSDGSHLPAFLLRPVTIKA